MDIQFLPLAWSHNAARNLQIQQTIQPVDPLDIQMENHWTSSQTEVVKEGVSVSPVGSQPSLNTLITQPTSSTGNPCRGVTTGPWGSFQGLDACLLCVWECMCDLFFFLWSTVIFLLPLVPCYDSVFDHSVILCINVYYCFGILGQMLTPCLLFCFVLGLFDSLFPFGILEQHIFSSVCYSCVIFVCFVLISCTHVCHHFMYLFPFSYSVGLIVAPSHKSVRHEAVRAWLDSMTGGREDISST